MSMPFRPHHLALGFLAAALLSCTPQGGGGGRQMGPPPNQLAELEGKKFITAPGVGGLEGFSQAVKIGKRIYVSGQVGVDNTGRVVGASDLAAQAAQAFHNLQAVLLAAGATPEDVVHLDFYLVEPNETDLATVRQAGNVFFPAAGSPAGNVLGIQSLPKPGLRIAIAAVAETPGLFPDREAMRRYQ
jgi:enamine deaminase RidA (YjgF/YER057c/UK114 family)